jgi:hypothetical protein
MHHQVIVFFLTAMRIVASVLETARFPATVNELFMVNDTHSHDKKNTGGFPINSFMIPQ